MKTVQITEDAVLKAHSEATNKEKSLLENLFCGSVFKKEITDRVKSVEDACAILGKDDVDVIDYRKLLSAQVADHIIGNQELVIINKALNEGHTHDWSNGKWDKWYPWFDFNSDESSSSSGRFSFCTSGDQDSLSICGSRLCYKSEELAKYAGTQFLDIYKKVYTI